MKTQYDVNYFIRKFSVIPDERWTTHAQFRFDDSTRCAVGHCSALFGDDSAWKDEGSEARALAFVLFGSNSCDTVGRITSINDGSLMEYPQPTPKARILAALADAKARAEAALDEYETRKLDLTPHRKEQLA